MALVVKFLLDNKKYIILLFFVVIISACIYSFYNKEITFFESNNPDIKQITISEKDIKYKITNMDSIGDFIMLLKKYDVDKRAEYVDFFRSDDIIMEIDYVTKFGNFRHIIVCENNLAYLYEDIDKGIFKIKDSQKFIVEINNYFNKNL